MSSQLVIILSIFFLFSVSPNLIFAYETSTLKLVQVIFRHGDRTPLVFYPTDPYRDVAKYWPEGIGQLTPMGENRMYNFGLELRQRYVKFLSNNPSNELYVRSSSSSRCMETTIAVLVGLYPIQGRNIDIISDPKSEDILLKSPSCRAASKAKAVNSLKVRNALSSEQEFIDKVSFYTGLKITRLGQLYDLSGTLRNEKHYNLTLPAWVYQISDNTLEKLAAFQAMYFDVSSSSPVVKRLRAGPLLKELTENMIIAANGEEDVKRKKKIYLYGTHDTRIVEILQSIGVYRDQTPMIPNFGATIVFELHQVEGEFIVKVFNYYDTLLDPILMKMPTCMNDCKLDQFISAFKPLFPQDWKRECKYGIK